MRRYETIFISHPDLSVEELESLTQRMTETLQKSQGELVEIDQWGSQKLAYNIQKQSRGHYTRLDYAALPDAVKELERVLRLDDKVMKFLTVKMEDQVDLEAVRQAQVARKKAASPPPDAEMQETAPTPAEPAVEQTEPPEEAPSESTSEDQPQEN